MLVRLEAEREPALVAPMTGGVRSAIVLGAGVRPATAKSGPFILSARSLPAGASRSLTPRGLASIRWRAAVERVHPPAASGAHSPGVPEWRTRAASPARVASARRVAPVAPVADVAMLVRLRAEHEPPCECASGRMQELLE